MTKGGYRELIRVVLGLYKDCSAPAGLTEFYRVLLKNETNVTELCKSYLHISDWGAFNGDLAALLCAKALLKKTLAAKAVDKKIKVNLLSLIRQGGDIHLFRGAVLLGKVLCVTETAEIDFAKAVNEIDKSTADTELKLEAMELYATIHEVRYGAKKTGT